MDKSVLTALIKEQNYSEIKRLRCEELHKAIPNRMFSMLTNEEMTRKIVSAITEDSLVNEIVDFYAMHSEENVDLASLMDALYYPSSYLQKIPEELKGPDVSCAHVWSNVIAYSMNFDAVEDDGLLVCDSPIGRTFNIKREDGIVAHLSVSKYCLKGTGGIKDDFGRDYSNCNQDIYLGKGTIDDILMGDSQPQIDNIALYVNEKTSEGFKGYISFYSDDRVGSQIIGPVYSPDKAPRWKAYYDACDQLWGRKKKEIERIATELFPGVSIMQFME